LGFEVKALLPSPKVVPLANCRGNITSKIKEILVLLKHVFERV